MSNQAELDKAKYIAVYYNYKGDHTTTHILLGHSIEHLANWGYLERQGCSELTIFKVEKIDKKIVRKAIEDHDKKEEQKYKREKKAKLLAELKEFEDE